MQDETKPQVQQPQVDHSEGQMARADLYRGAKNAMKLFQMVQDGQQLEGWVQAKITKAADYLDSVYHYMEYQAKFGQGGVAIPLVWTTLPLTPLFPENKVQFLKKTMKRKLKNL